MPSRSVTASPPRFETAAAGGAPLVWLDALKGVALLWIVLDHVVEQLFGSEYVGNPTATWPPLAARVAQYVTPAGSGTLGFLATAVRDVGWLGDQGVTLFLIASGFGIALSLSRRTAPLAAPRFYAARAARIYPLWLAAHVAVAIAAFVTFAKLGPAFVLSAAGIRFLPQTMYAFVPAWWYVGLLLQLYALVPCLWALLRRFGPWPVLAGSCVLGFAARAAGFVVFAGAHGDYLDAWERGAIFVTRLPEFALGMCLAVNLARAAERPHVSRGPAAVACACAAFLVGFACAFTRAGTAFAPLLMGGGAFVLLGAVLDRGRPRGLAWIGRNSYALYLVHQPFVSALVPPAADVTFLAGTLRIGAAAGATALAARALEAATDAFVALARRLRTRGAATALATGALALAAGYGALLAGDRLAAAIAPEEIDGWGERPSLEPSTAFGWTLIPGTTTRLRWTSYDYVVRANALGFPAPEPPVAKPRGTLRVLVTGDAFTSGEGVGTGAAWPRLLERDLARRTHRNVQVLNFGITGYGPDQEVRVLEAFVPRYHPDVVVLESFVNAFEKLGLTDAEIRASIGFGRPPGNGARATLRLLHLRTALLEDAIWPLDERLTGIPSPADAGFADADAFERDDPDLAAERIAYRARLRRALATARAAHAALVVVMIPSRAQVCSAGDFARGAFVRLAGDVRYDAGRPQRDAAAAARSLGIPFLDLRGALANGACPYQRRNMHFVPAGDARTAAAVAAALARLPGDARAGPGYPPG